MTNQYEQLSERFLKADELIKEKKISEALEILHSIVQTDPSFGKAYNHLGWTYIYHLSDYKKAEEYYKNAIKYDPSYTATYMNYAYLLSMQRRYNELETLLKQSLKIEGINKDSVYNEYGIMYELKNNYKDAVIAFKEAIKNSLDANIITTYQANIFRCKTKAGFLKSLFW